MSNATIIIELVRHNGRLVGRTVSDRWNLAVYGMESLADTRNQADVKALRRKASKDGLTVRVVAGDKQFRMTDAETAAFARPGDHPDVADDIAMMRFYDAVDLAVVAPAVGPAVAPETPVHIPLDFDRSPLDRPGYDHRATVAYVLDAPANFPADYASWR